MKPKRGFSFSNVLEIGHNCRAKRKGRPELKPEDWYKHGYASKPDVWRDIDFKDTMTRINYHEVSEEEFIERFEKPGRPVIIQVRALRASLHMYLSSGLEYWNRFFMLWMCFVNNAQHCSGCL